MAELVRRVLFSRAVYGAGYVQISVQGDTTVEHGHIHIHPLVYAVDGCCLASKPADQA